MIAVIKGIEDIFPNFLQIIHILIRMCHRNLINMKYIWEKMDQNVCKKIPIFDLIYVFNLKVYLNLANKLSIIAKDF